MPAISVTTVGVADPVPYPELADRLGCYTTNPLEFVVLNAGMTSGAPSVQILCRQALPDGGHVVLETSLQALIAATRTAQIMAESRFGWTHE